MKRLLLAIIIIITLSAFNIVSAQDFQATNQALELELTILKLQATKNALGNQISQQFQPPSDPSAG